MKHTTLLLPSSSSGAIHPSVPVIPDFVDKDTFPWANFRHSPKSDILVFTFPFTSGKERRTLRGLTSR